MEYALITGASKGIGKCIAIELAKRSYNLVLIARSKALLEDVALEITQAYPHVKVQTIAVDLSDPNASQDIYAWVIEKNISISILVNNAGYGLVGPFDTYSLTETHNMMTLNMTALTDMCYTFLPMLKQQKQAYILNISSSTAYQALPLMAVYAATKVYVLHFSRALTQELKKTNVWITCVSPGSTDTAFVERANVKEKALKAAAKVNMTPEQVAKLAVAGMFAKKTEVITGLVNKLGAFMAWLLPKGLIENIASNIYK